jgi:hypothetical protein
MVQVTERGRALAEVLTRRRWVSMAPQVMDYFAPVVVRDAIVGLAADKGQGSLERDAILGRVRQDLCSRASFGLACDVWNACVREALDPPCAAVEAVRCAVRERGESANVIEFIDALAAHKRENFSEDMRLVEFVGEDASSETADAPRPEGGRDLGIVGRPAAGLDAIAAGDPVLRALLHPSLAELLEREGLGNRGLAVSVPDELPHDRHDIEIQTPWRRKVTWRAPELPDLATGTLPAPAPGVLDRSTPPELEPLVEALERGVLHALSVLADAPTDQEVLQTCGLVRRRASGRSHGPFFDVLWRHAALELALREYSRAEFEAVLLGIERRVRAHRDAPASRNYFHALVQDVFRGAEGEERIRSAVAWLASGGAPSLRLTAPHGAGTA